MTYIIRQLNVTDINELQQFFIKAYGNETIFQDREFLRWYFGGINFKNGSKLNCFAAINNQGEIVSHLGGIVCELMLDGHPIHFFWAVNAYTIPEYRKMGMGSRIATMLMKKYDAFGVIGFSLKTAKFYESQDVNLFSFKQFHRYILNFDERSFEVLEKIGTDLVKARQLFKIIKKSPPNTHEHENTNLVYITSENIRNYSIGYNIEEKAVILRDMDYLKWRFIDNPYTKYQWIAYVLKNQILAYLVVRREQLIPMSYYATRIVDIYGCDDYIKILISQVITQAHEQGDIFLDFSAFGIHYDKILKDLKFRCVKNNNVCLFPQVTSPIENRPNQEYIGLYSSVYKSKIARLKEKDVFFTRADSDRDRLAKIWQMFPCRGAE